MTPVRRAPDAAGMTALIPPDDVAVTLAVRNDLGSAHDEAVIAEFLDRVGDRIDARVEQQVAERLAAQPAPGKVDHEGLAICSLVFGIPITAISLGATEGLASLLALAISWTGIGVVNLAARRR